MKKKKRAQVKKNNTSNKNRTANPPENLLKPFKSSYRKAKWLTYGTSFIIFCNWAAILLGVLSFSLDQLKSLVSFTFNIIFVFAAFVFTIFSLHSNIKSHPQKDTVAEGSSD